MTALKTVEYAFPVLASLGDNTLTALTQITAYLPESSKTFRAVWVEVSCDDIITATGGTVASHQVQISVNGATATNVTNANAATNTGENLSLFYTADFTAHFTSNWGTATSRTVDCSVLVDQNTGTTLGQVNVCVTLHITYEYDETSTTHVKTVWIPLNAPVGAVATSKPGSATATIPDLSTYCPEASKTFRQISIVVQGNTQVNASTTDSNLSIEIDSAGAQTTGNHEAALASDRWFRYVFQGQSFSTSASHSFYLWGSQARYNHLQVWMMVTYEFSPSSSTSILNSIWLPLEFGRQMGGTASSDFARATTDIYIEEPTTIGNTTVAAYITWDINNPIAGINARVGTGSFVAYTDSGGVYAGGNGLMVRNDSAYTLARGRNIIGVDIYRTDGSDVGVGTTGRLLVCYTSGKPTAGVHVANHTVIWSLVEKGTSNTAQFQDVSDDIAIPEANYFCTPFYQFSWYGSTAVGFCVVATVRNSANSATAGAKFGHATGGVQSDSEIGLRMFTFRLGDVIYRWVGDPDTTRVDIESTTNSWTIDWSTSGFYWSQLYITYHAISVTADGTIHGAASGTVNIALHRASDGLLLATASRSGSGAWSTTWYDDADDVYIAAVDSTGRAGRSRNGKAGIDDLDVVLGVPFARAA